MRCLKEKKQLVSIIIILQIIFLVSIVAVGVIYQVKIITDMNSIVKPLETANYNPEELEKGMPFIENMAQVQKSYQSLKQNIVELAVWFSLLLIIFQGGLWLLSHLVVQKYSLRDLGQMYIKYLAVTSSLLILFFGLAYFLLKDLIINAVDVQFVAMVTRYLVAAFVIVYYLLLVFWTGLHQKEWKSFFRYWKECAIKKIHWTILAISIPTALVAGLFYLMYTFLSPEQVAIAMACLLLLMVLLALSRIFLITTMNAVYHTGQDKSAIDHTIKRLKDND